MTDVISRRRAPTAGLVAVVLSALPLLAVLVLPLYSSSSSMDSGGQTTVVETRETLVEVNGTRILYVLAVPVALTLIGFLCVRTRYALPVLLGVAALMWIGTILSGFTVGFLYLPADFALVFAITAVPSPRRFPVPGRAGP